MPDKAPAFQFYPRDWLTDARVIVMDNEARGAYLTLLCVCWLEGGTLPADDAALARLALCTPKAWARLRESILPCFTLDATANLYRHKRLDVERDKQRAHQEDAAEHGRKGARARWTGKPETPRAMPEQCPSNARAMPADGSASASAFASSEGPTKSPAEDAAAWLLDAYPRWYAEERNGARYVVRPAFDAPAAFQLVTTWPDRAHLERMARLFLRADNIVSAHANRGLALFADKYASACDARLRERGAA